MQKALDEYKSKKDKEITQSQKQIKDLTDSKDQEIAQLKNKLTSELCPVCFSEFEANNYICLKCNHRVCNECYIEYINDKLLSEPNNILFTPCPLNGCNLYLTRTIFKKCITEKNMQRKNNYYLFLRYLK